MGFIHCLPSLGSNIFIETSGDKRRQVASRQETRISRPATATGQNRFFQPSPKTNITRAATIAVAAADVAAAAVDVAAAAIAIAAAAGNVGENTSSGRGKLQWLPTARESCKLIAMQTATQL